MRSPATVRLLCGLFVLILSCVAAFADAPTSNAEKQNANAAAQVVPPSEEQMVQTRQKLDEALSQREFGNARLTRNILDRVAIVVRDFIRGIFDSLGGLGLGGTILGYVIIAIVVALLIFLLVHLMTRVFHLPSTRVVDERDPMQMRQVKSAAEWMQIAEQHRMRGEQLSAVRYAYIALLVRLHEIDAVQLESGRTNWEILRQLRAHPHYPIMLDATELLESRLYAMTPIETDDFDRLKHHYATVVPIA